jgi:DNA-binding NarL/FixJ family response regulator
MLVDDHELLRRGLRNTLVDDYAMEVVAEAATLADARRLLPEATADVVVVDVNLPDGDGISFVRGLRQDGHGLGIVVLTMSPDDAHLLASLDAGASAFVRKDAPSEEVVAAVGHAAAAPHQFTSTGIAAALQVRAVVRVPQLTPREREVLQLLSQGLVAGAIGRRLYIGEATVKTHIASLYEKLEAHNRAQAIMTALHFGLIG